MKDFLQTIYIDTFYGGDWLGYLFGIIAWLFTIFVSILLICFFAWIIDSSFLPLKNSYGVATNKSYTPPYSTTTFTIIGKVMVPIIMNHEEEYRVEIKINDLTGTILLCKEDWDNIEIGNKICCQYSIGRIKNTLYIKSFCHPPPTPTP